MTGSQGETECSPGEERQDMMLPRYLATGGDRKKERQWARDGEVSGESRQYIVTGNLSECSIMCVLKT